MKAYVNMSDYAVNERNKRALDDLVWRVMENEEGRPFDLVDFLAEQESLPSMVMQARYEKDWGLFDAWLEALLRLELEDSEAVQDRAEEMSREEE